MDALLQHLELQPRTDCHEQLPVEDAAVRQLLPGGLDDLREVAGQRLGVARGQLDLVAVLEHETAEPVPLGFK